MQLIKRWRLLTRKNWRKLNEQVLALLKVVCNTLGEVMHSGQGRRAVKFDMPQFADKVEESADKFSMAILPILQLPSYKGVFHEH